MFDYDYAEIARILDASEANCRQMLKRAKDHVRERRPRFDPAPEQRDQLLGQFVQACANGDMQGLLVLFANEITLYADGGGKVQSARNPIHGPLNVARFLLGVLAKAPPGFAARPMTINGQPGLMIYLDGQPYTAITFAVTDGRISAIYNQLNPEKLRHVPPL